MTLYPKARHPEADTDIITVDMADEYIIYDLSNDHVHELNPTASAVWQWCDGDTPYDILITRLAQMHHLSQEQAESLFWLTLGELEAAGLLANRVERPSQGQGVSRRDILARVGVAALLPVVYTVIAPEPLQAQSGGTPTTVTYYENAGCTGSSYTFNISDLGGGPLSSCCTPNATDDDPCGEGQNVLSYQTDTGSCTSC